jgi:hypothetical protein
MAKTMCPDCHHDANVDMCTGRCFCGHCGKEWMCPAPVKTRKAHVSMTYRNMEIFCTLHLDGDFMEWMAKITNNISPFLTDGTTLHSITFFEEENSEKF